MKYVLIGKLVNTHGLKGEVRILSKFKYKDRVFVPGMKIYIGKDKKEEVIATYRHHKIFEMITMNGYSDINEILKYKGDYVFVNKEDIKLNENEYLDEDIIGLRVYVDGIYLGEVTKIEDHHGNEILVVTNDKNGVATRRLIPYNMNIIKSINLEKNEIYVEKIDGLTN